MPATQVYFKQKTFTEARELSEAIGRTTIEEATVNDNGRVQEMIQGRALITPDELIGLKNEVVIFAPDSNPQDCHSSLRLHTTMRCDTTHRNEKDTK